MNFKMRMLVTWSLACLALGSICLALYLRGAQEQEQSIRERESGRVALFAQIFGQDFRGVAVDLVMLTESATLQDFLATEGVSPLARLTGELALLSRHNEEYDQIRFLDQSGQERVRVNLGGKIVPAAELQLKADRPYFREALPLPAGQIYLSQFDLNIDKGVVERPIKPMLRFAAPVFDT